MAMEKFASKLAPEKIRICYVFLNYKLHKKGSHISKCNRHLPNVKSKAPVSDGHGNVFQGIVSENKTKRWKWNGGISKKKLLHFCDFCAWGKYNSDAV